MRVVCRLAGFLVAVAAVASDPFYADAQRGSAFFARSACLVCHSVNGQGGGAAPDLSKRIGRDYSPSGMASTMWNHAPAMWSAMRQRGITAAHMDEARARDLFAYFYSARYFDKPGDAARGKRLFAGNRCAGCHGVAPDAAGARPVARWHSISDPIQLAQEMWGHPAVRSRHRRPRLTPQELTDMLVYLQNLPETRERSGGYALALTEAGVAPGSAARSSGCGRVECHGSRVEARMRNRTLVDVAVAVWNHAPNSSPGQVDVRRSLVLEYISEVWANQFLRTDGRAARGKQVFAAKGCATCHNDPAANVPDLSRREQAYSPVSMMSALWEHGPRILEEMQKRNLPWPRFTQTEMSDLIAYLNALPRPGGPAQPVVLRAEIIPLTGERAVLSATK